MIYKEPKRELAEELGEELPDDGVLNPHGAAALPPHPLLSPSEQRTSCEPSPLLTTDSAC